MNTSVRSHCSRKSIPLPSYIPRQNSSPKCNVLKAFTVYNESQRCELISGARTKSLARYTDRALCLKIVESNDVIRSVDLTCLCIVLASRACRILQGRSVSIWHLSRLNNRLKYEDATVVNFKVTVFSAITPCGLVDICRLFRVNCCYILT
jgi:hypothetical protein